MTCVMNTVSVEDTYSMMFVMRYLCLQITFIEHIVIAGGPQTIYDIKRWTDET